MSTAPSLAGSFQLVSGEVHSWCASLDVLPATSARLYATLSLEERHRSARFRFERDQQRFIAAHGVLRELLGRYLQTQPGRISYVHNAFGKPDLSPEFGGRLKFNLSHSAGLALVAIAADADIGVDVEYIRTQPDDAEIARCFFSTAEADQLLSLPNHLYAEAFISCWTKKEAYLKACGNGLTVPLNVASADIAPAKRWSFFSLQPAPGYIGTLAIEGGCWRLEQWRWR